MGRGPSSTPKLGPNLAQLGPTGVQLGPIWNAAWGMGRGGIGWVGVDGSGLGMSRVG